MPVMPPFPPLPPLVSMLLHIVDPGVPPATAVGVMHAFSVIAVGAGASSPFVAVPLGAVPAMPSPASLAVTSQRSSAAATSATTTALDDPPSVILLGLAPVIAKPSTFAPSAAFVTVSAIASAGPSSVALALGDHTHPFVQSNPPYTSMPVLMVTASPNGALVQAYTRLPAACAAITASPSFANGIAIEPSPPEGASA